MLEYLCSSSRILTSGFICCFLRVCYLPYLLLFSIPFPSLQFSPLLNSFLTAFLFHSSSLPSSLSFPLYSSLFTSMLSLSSFPSSFAVLPFLEGSVRQRLQSIVAGQEIRVADRRRRGDGEGDVVLRHQCPWWPRKQGGKGRSWWRGNNVPSRKGLGQWEWAMRIRQCGQWPRRQVGSEYREVPMKEASDSLGSSLQWVQRPWNKVAGFTGRLGTWNK